MNESIKLKPIIGAITGLLAMVIIGFVLPAPEGLTASSMIVLGTLVCAVIYWIFNVMPDFVVGLLMCATWVVFKVVEFPVAFAQFANTNWWMVIGALGIGIAVSETGLMKRVALHTMKFFPKNFKGQSLAVFLAGIIVSPMIPSTNAKGSIAAPLSLSISDTMGYQHKSKASAGMFMSMFYGFVCASPIFLSATFMNYVGRGLIEGQMSSVITWGSWFIYALPWALVFLVLSYFAIQFFYKPEKEVQLPSDFISNQLLDLGKMSRQETITALVLIATLIFWMLERVTGVSSTIVSLIALSILLGLKVISVPQFKNGIPWNAILFIGFALNLGVVLPAVGVDKWISSSLSGVLQPVLGNPYLLIIVLTLMIYAARFLLVSLTAAVTMFVLMVLPLITSSSVSPFVIVFVTITSVNIWLLKYQNPPFLTTYYAINGEMADDKQIRLGAMIYMVINLIGLLVSIPFWHLMGLL
jgi:DASS family divalent anion:Na+ symporter